MANGLTTSLSPAESAGENVTVEVGEEISQKAEEVFLRLVLVELSEAVPYSGA